VKVGTTLPQFQPDAGRLFDAVQRAERLGLHGVFVFDHLWPIGRPDRAILPSTGLLGAIAAETASIAVGTLVARIGLRPDAVLVHELATAARIAPGRIIAGLGTGDRLSAPENLAYGLAYPPREERLASLERCARALRERGITVWAGGRSRAVRDISRGADALNLWEAPVTEVGDAVAAGLTVTWGGQVPPGVRVADHLRALAEAGAVWAVVGWSEELEELAAAAP